MRMPWAYAWVLFGAGFCHAAPARLAAGTDHLLLLRADGSLWGMGSDVYGQIGSAGRAPQDHPVPIAARAWIKVAAGDRFSLALCADGSLWAFGRNQAGQLGKGNRKAYINPHRVGDNRWLDMAAGRDATLAVRADGSLRLWGGWESDSGNRAAKHGLAGVLGLSRLAAGGRWKAVAMGADHALALREDGSLWAMGSNASGQTGCGEAEAYDALCRVGDASARWIAMAAGEGFSVGLRVDGSLWTWGGNARGEAGRGTASPREAMGRVGSGKWIALAAGGRHALALREDGTLWAWGEGGAGASGLDGSEGRNAPAQVGTEKWTAIAAGERFSAGVQAGGQIKIWGDLGFAAGTGAPEGAFVVRRPAAIEKWQDDASPGNTAVTVAVPDPPVSPIPGSRTPLPAPVAAAPAPEPAAAAPFPDPAAQAAASDVSVPPSQASQPAVASIPPRPALPAATPPAASAAAIPSWSRVHRTWLMAGGGAVVAGAALWAYLAISGEKGSSRPADLGVPPGDPVVLETP